MELEVGDALDDKAGAVTEDNAGAEKGAKAGLISNVEAEDSEIDVEDATEGKSEETEAVLEALDTS